jgi:hypothetical protein
MKYDNQVQANCHPIFGRNKLTPGRSERQLLPRKGVVFHAKKGTVDRVSLTDAFFI